MEKKKERKKAEEEESADSVRRPRARQWREGATLRDKKKSPERES
jgi:hypothetical protein